MLSYFLIKKDISVIKNLHELLNLCEILLLFILSVKFYVMLQKKVNTFIHMKNYLSSVLKNKKIHKLISY